jgi:hypothetical protein
MKTLVDMYEASGGPAIMVIQCETRSEWANDWSVKEMHDAFSHVFETNDNKRAILYGQHENHWNYWEVVLEP